MLRALFLVVALSSVAASAAADAQDPEGPEPPGYQVVVTGMEAFPDRVFVNVTSVVTAATRRSARSESASYTLVREFPVDHPERLCAVPASWVIDSPAGGLGSRMLRGARGASGDVATDPAFVAELLALFDSPEVACADAFVPPGAEDRRVERVVDTVRAAAIDGRVLRLELVETGYQVSGAALVRVPAASGSSSRPPLPASRPRGCACAVVGVGPTPPALAALGAVLTLGLLAHRARRRPRLRDGLPLRNACGRETQPRA